MKNITIIILILAVFAVKAVAQLPVMVADINAGTNCFAPHSFITYNNKLFFKMFDGTNYGLYSTEGTAATTSLVYNVGANSGQLRPIVFNNMLFFVNNEATYGNELWITDGTTAGTQIFKDIHPGAAFSQPDYFILMGNKMYFSATNSTYGRELWVSDGTSLGTTILKDINPGSNFGYNSEGTILYNNKLYFAGNDGINGDELWVSDGTAAGTVMLKDIHPSGNSEPKHFCVHDNKLYFTAYTTTNGRELWVSDGTSAGTYMLKDINPGTVGAFASNYSLVNLIVSLNLGIVKRLIFVANDGTHGFEIWQSNGTAAGTTMVKDINPGSASSIAISGSVIPILTYSNFKVYFSATDGINGDEIWNTSGTEASTEMIKNINPSSSSWPKSFITYHGKTFFTADDGTNGTHLWYTNGTEAGTSIIAPLIFTEIDPLLSTTDLYVHDYALYFNAKYNSNGCELWKLDLPWYITTTSLPVNGGTTTGDGPYHQGDSVSLTATPNSGYAFINWTESGTQVSSSHTYDFICGAGDRNFVANFQLISGMEEEAEASIRIFPNPAADKININIENHIAADYKIMIYNSDGRLIQNLSDLKTGANELNVSHLPTGIYILKIFNDRQIKQMKFVKI